MIEALTAWITCYLATIYLWLGLIEWSCRHTLNTDKRKYFVLASTKVKRTFIFFVNPSFGLHMQACFLLWLFFQIFNIEDTYQSVYCAMLTGIVFSPAFDIILCLLHQMGAGVCCAARQLLFAPVDQYESGSRTHYNPWAGWRRLHFYPPIKHPILNDIHLLTITKSISNSTNYKQWHLPRNPGF